MYHPIANYAIIGDTHTAALIGIDGSIDWACFPDFNSPAVFLRLLDDTKGGYCAIVPQRLRSSRRRYLEQTNILETTFVTETGVLTVTDFMPVRQADAAREHGQDVLSDHRIVRLLRCTEGKIDYRLELKPTFNYARNTAHVFRRGPSCLMFSSGPLAVYAQLPADLEWRDDVAVAQGQLERGAVCPIVLTFTDSPDYEIKPLSNKEVQAELDRSRAYWEQWSRACKYDGDFRDLVLRSALTLKLLTYEPTGAIVASPTASLPERVGGSRNWDYRYCWLRDSTFTLIALMNLGYFGEAHDFFKFLHRTLPADAGKTQILYGIDGSRDATEQELKYLEGYRGSRPVRIGNGAAEQTQLDIFGELVHCVDLYWHEYGMAHQDENFERDFWPAVRTIADHVAHHWADRDQGMWEMRGPARQFTTSKAMCWMALDRAIGIARQHQLKCDVAYWQRERDLLRDSFLREGFNRDLGAYTQYYGSDHADASLLRLPLMGVVRADEARMRSTVALIEKQLLRDGLLYRYDAAKDGIGEHEGAFTACSFWLVENYILQGRMREAEEMFRHVVSFANDVGLMSEQLNVKTGEQVGNFPQGFTHIGLVNAAIRLDMAKRDAQGGQSHLRPTQNTRTMSSQEPQAA